MPPNRIDRTAANMFNDRLKTWCSPARSVSLGALLVLIAASTGSRRFEPTHSYLIQAADYSFARSAVAQAHGRITHELPIINAVAADLSAQQLESLKHGARLMVMPNRSVRLSGNSASDSGSSAQEVQPYVVERTQANLLHAAGITGAGVTIAFLDTGWWSQQAVQVDTHNHQAVLQGFDATNPNGGTVGVGAPDDHYGHGTHVLSIAVNSALAEDGTYIGMAPDASRVIVRAFDQNGEGTYASAIQGMNWILQNAKRYNIRIVNMSFGATPQSYYWQDPLAQAVMRLWQAGIVVIAAAGNKGPAPRRSMCRATCPT